MATEQFDKMLERYLGLLDEYMTLRASLNSLQAGMYQNIARANFSAERGKRYGQDFYDDRMRAFRTVSVNADSKGTLHFEVIKTTDPEKAPAKDGEDLEKNRKGMVDPLRWYGLLAPMPLRQAQTQAVQAVESVIPKLLSVVAEMGELEIEVRRARKKRSRAEASDKDKDHGAEQTELSVPQATPAT